VAGVDQGQGRLVAPDIASAALWVIPLLLALVCHEWAHGYAAFRLGDDTAASLGRLTLNPIAHIDPIGTILLPGLLFMSGAPMFGWAKPVPVAFNRLRDPVRGMALVAAAGPCMNLVLAVASALIYRLLSSGAFGIPMAAGPDSFAVAQPVAIMCVYSIQLNVLLAVLNMLPIPPLDGGRVAVGLLPYEYSQRVAALEPYGMIIVVVLLMTGMLSVILGPLMGVVISLVRLLM